MRWTISIETSQQVYYYNLEVNDLSPLPFNLPPNSKLLYLNFDTALILAVM